MDQEAENAVRQAMNGPEPRNKVTIPARASKALNDPLTGLTRVLKAIDDMVNRGDMEAPVEPWKSWKLLR
jgi:hypothetical protein